MPTESQWEDRIREACDRAGGVQVAAEMEAAISEHPTSVRLWCLRGDVIQVSDDPIEAYDLPEALRSYHRALELDPRCAEAHESIGHYLDAIEDRPADAEPWFRRAIEYGAPASAWSGLAQVLAQLGRRAEAAELLATCPHAGDPDVETTREEIAGGEWDPVDPQAG